jgi:tRNA dimethylallyltransferase
MSSQPPLIVVVGPTAVGKTALAIHLAQVLNAEIVSADSRQVYRWMDIGTAKPTRSERLAARHHLIDIRDPDQTLSLAEFQGLAYRAIDDVLSAGRVPLLVGGTGQYVRAVVEGWGVPEVSPCVELRADLESVADVYGPTALHAWLAGIDPVAAPTIDFRNVRRVVRAIEVFLVSGQRFSRQRARRTPEYRILEIGLTRPRDRLYVRLDQRVEAMIRSGWVAEVAALLQRGYGPELPSLSSLGYPQIIAFLRGELSLEGAVDQVRRETRRFVRHQANWFRLSDPSIHWFNLETAMVDDILHFVLDWLTQRR